MGLVDSLLAELPLLELEEPLGNGWLVAAVDNITASRDVDVVVGVVLAAATVVILAAATLGLLAGTDSST